LDSSQGNTTPKDRIIIEERQVELWKDMDNIEESSFEMWNDMGNMAEK
jgi:hypothetical protein